jgi:hypothetical protein
MAKQKSPDLTVYLVGQVVEVPELAGAAAVVDAVPVPETHSTWPTWMSQLESTVGFNVKSCASVKPNSVHMAKHVSPDLTVYVSPHMRVVEVGLPAADGAVVGAEVDLLVLVAKIVVVVLSVGPATQ